MSGADSGFQFAFFRANPASLNRHVWCEQVLNLLAQDAIAPSHFSSGKRLVKAPKTQAALVEKLTSADVERATIQAGVNPSNADPVNGWAHIFSVDFVTGEICVGRHLPADSNLDSLARWSASLARAFCAAGKFDYGYAYLADFAKDISFGLGMIEGKPSAVLREFATTDAIGKWSRACIWRTHTGYLRDVFAVNILDANWLAREVNGQPLGKLAARMGTVVAINEALSMWTLPSPDDRRQAAADMAAAHLLVTHHAEGTYSQKRA